MGLTLNISKCELICHPQLHLRSSMLGSFAKLSLSESSLLGAPLFPGKALDDVWTHCINNLTTAIDRLSHIQSHDALILLRACFSSTKVMHLLRCSPCADHPALNEFDNLLRFGTTRITNSSLTNRQWLQASLPIKDGGLGIRRAVSLAFPAFLASAASTRALQDTIFGQLSVAEDPFVTEYVARWSSMLSVPTPPAPAAFKQSAWDRPGINADWALVRSSADNSLDLARLNAVSAPHSGDWLLALPIAACGLRLDNEAVRVAVGLRLGVDLCTPHQCSCGSTVDAKGVHALSCRKGASRLARHQALNEILWRGMASAGVPATKEPVGLSRDDGKRPDGTTLIPWHDGKNLAWDVTVINTVADSYIGLSAQQPCGAAENAAERKNLKYSSLPSTLLFQPVAFETLGPLNSSAVEFITELGRRISFSSSEPREITFLFQRLSTVIQRFDALCLKESFASTTWQSD